MGEVYDGDLAGRVRLLKACQVAQGDAGGMVKLSWTWRWCGRYHPWRAQDWDSGAYDNATCAHCGLPLPPTPVDMAPMVDAAFAVWLGLGPPYMFSLEERTALLKSLLGVHAGK